MKKKEKNQFAYAQFSYSLLVPIIAYSLQAN